MTDWVDWHREYEDPHSRLSRRLAVVCARIDEALDRIDEARSPRILSLCAGDGRDLLHVLERHDRPVEALLVDSDTTLAARARERARQRELIGVEVRCADAADTAVFAGVLPVDILLLCGIFGNVSDADIRAIVRATPEMLTVGGTVIWTRRASSPDLRPVIRRWFVDAGLVETSFDGAPETFGVGANRRVGGPVQARPRLPATLFRFIR